MAGGEQERGILTHSWVGEQHMVGLTPPEVQATSGVWVWGCAP